MSVAVSAQIVASDAVCAAVPHDTRVLSFPLLSLPDDVLGLVLRHVRPRYRLHVVRCCKRMCHEALSRSYPPWENAARGLLFAISKGFRDYFDYWRAIAGARWTTVVARYGLCLMERCLVKGNVTLCVMLLGDVQVTDDFVAEVVRSHNPEATGIIEAICNRENCVVIGPSTLRAAMDAASLNPQNIGQSQRHPRAPLYGLSLYVRLPSGEVAPHYAHDTHCAAMLKRVRMLSRHWCLEGEPSDEIVGADIAFALVRPVPRTDGKVLSKKEQRMAKKERRNRTVCY